ncbi:hypothetical protein [Mesorhizobium silamurunense]|uniref:hypothetical protein n=1 Tax=Mesorhizobium silamurunense TaxID=499528 RepID=UPI0017877B29|nr:hypothetical protein [Mesorhizobium silamurunense]
MLDVNGTKVAHPRRCRIKAAAIVALSGTLQIGRQLRSKISAHHYRWKSQSGPNFLVPSLAGRSAAFFSAPPQTLMLGRLMPSDLPQVPPADALEA